MPVAVIAVSMLFVMVLTAPCEATRSCMSRTEARQTLGSVHIYRHRPDRCWDATPIGGIETVQEASPSINPRGSELTATPGGLVLVMLAIVLMLATIEVLFRCTIF